MSTRFASDIRPLFRDKDISSMKTFGQFDLSNYDDVVSWADEILDKLRSGQMPCDEKWPKQQIELFQAWISDGKLP
ncbi:MAG: hypothetical protein JSR89_06045 [Proteobacteria bacterium]|nr:hypothetical protein [Pseudomonadota bacterium]